MYINAHMMNTIASVEKMIRSQMDATNNLANSETMRNLNKSLNQMQKFISPIMRRHN